MNDYRKILIYQVLPRYFGNTKRGSVKNGSLSENGVGKFNHFTKAALEAIKSLGVTHVWYTGVLEHATQTDYSSYGILKDHPAVVKGKAGSPYAVKDYYDVDPDLAVSVPDRMKEFQNLVKRTHQQGLKVIIDFIPNHLARQYHSDAAPEGVADFGANDMKDWYFSPQNNFYYFPGQSFRGQFDLCAGADEPYEEMPVKVTGNDCFSACPSVNDWYETVKLNYGVDYQGCHTEYFDPIPDTWLKMREILLYWCAKGVDAFRCDMAEMVPAAFWAWVTKQVKTQYPDILFIGEVYNPGLYRQYLQSGFDYLYDKIGLYDSLKAVVQGYAPAFSLTRCWQSLGDIQEHMLNFLENHDEQRLASPFFAGDARKGLPALVVSATMNVNPFMLYCGQELGESGMYEEGFSGRDGRSTIFDYWCIDSVAAWNNKGKFNNEKLSDEQAWLRGQYQKILQVCQSEKAITQGQFYDLMYVNADRSRFDDTKLYAYMRKYKNELILVVANFGDKDAHASVRIPQHLFDFWQIKPQNATDAVDLLTAERLIYPLNPDSCIPMQIPGNQSRIIKFVLE